CYDDALAHLDIALAENPGSPLLLGSLGAVRMRLGFYPEAVEAYERAIAAAVGDSPERVRQRRILAVYLAEAQAADWRLDRARAASRRFGGSEALALLAKTRSEYPSSPLPRFLAGRLLLEGRRYEEAERELAAAQERAPEPPAWLIGWIELDRGLTQRGLGHRE